jgi:phosphatidylserine/phosphatidylglycerophosphate/cardiolipin synthase-like enzyme
LKVFRGDGCALLCFDVDERLQDNLAGFAIEYVTPSGTRRDVKNRLSFAERVTAETTPEDRRWTPTSEAPLQTFRWVHFPHEVEPGTFTYRATAMLFKPGSQTAIQRGPAVEVPLDLLDEGFSRFQMAFTRGYLSSQAYATRFRNAPFQPHRPTIDFDTSAYERRWEWLGFNARRVLFDFLRETIAQPSLSLDVFAYDLNEPDFIRALVQLGPRLRLFLDDSHEHSKAGARELAARAALEASAGTANVKVGHFDRFAHDKVLIQKHGARALKVLSGSANFSIRGLYVQSNNVFVFDDPETATLYARAFQQTWDAAGRFDGSEIASRWFGIRDPELPRMFISFAPHRTADVSLTRVAEAIRDARSSVLYSIMNIDGTGDVLEEIRALPRRDLYAFGTTQATSGSLTVAASGRRAVSVPFSFLKEKVPPPFREEIAGGLGQVIHHKFVIVDFNDLEPVVFAGSSNLAAGGETMNGDNLVAFYDRRIASIYAVEAIRLIDHYRFRAAMRTATNVKPLRLKRRSERWAAAFYDPRNARLRERLLFVR